MTDIVTTAEEWPLLVSMERARRELGDCSERHIYNLIASGKLTRVKVGKSTKITSESVKKLAMGK